MSVNDIECVYGDIANSNPVPDEAAENIDLWTA